jgi:hypothetical protein
LHGPFLISFVPTSIHFLKFVAVPPDGGVYMT